MIFAQKNINLKSLNTFGIDNQCDFYIEINNISDINEFLKSEYANYPCLIINGGSNILLTNDWKGVVLKINIKGIEIITETNEYVLIKAYAGENWNDFVNYCISHQWSGIENMVEIPGNVGSCPIQNIGAYGMEVKDSIKYVEAIDKQTGEIITFNNKDCQFDYRSSIFKTNMKNKYIITSVIFQLNKTFTPNIDYADILNYIGSKDISLNTVAEAIREIRKNKLPSYEEFGNAGSFFKNPYISMDKYNELKINYPNIPAYPINPKTYKISAAWLIDQCGWKGYREGECGVHHKQPLVLINYGKATGKDILNLSESIIKSIEQKFGITLEREVNIF